MGKGIDSVDDEFSKQWLEVFKAFVSLVLKSPMAIITMVMSFFLGYGISFVLFDYRTKSANKSHYLFHLLVGLGYTALIFLIVNWKHLNSNMTEEAFTKLMPLTLLISFAVSFLLITTLAIIRELKKPYNQ